MFWRAYYVIKKNNYLKISTILICICSVSAIGLNIEGTKCISQINAVFEDASIQDGSGLENTESLGGIDTGGIGGVSSENNNSQGSSFQDSDTTREQQLEEEERQQQMEEEEEEQQKAMRESFELRRYCFVVTNLYVYSLFGITIGFIIIAVWYIKYKKIWTKKSSSLDK